uniref:BCAS3 domain-containing protein n=1 Tax=Romanomermis culicivorax TaxID=13658 RepID=A0A915JZN2_ROMCU
MPSPSSSASQNTDKVEWVSFADECDLCDPSVKSYLEGVVGPELPIIVTIGYTYGFQIWALLSNGECEELLFVKDGPATFVKFLPAPKVANKADELSSCRPLLAACDDSGPQFYSAVNVISLRQNGCAVRRLNFTDSVVNVLTSDRALIVTFIDKLVVLDPCTLKDRFWIKNCLTDLNPHSVSLSGSWCAYPDVKLNPTFQSCGGASCYDDSSYTTQVVTVAKNLSKTVTEISASLATMTGVGQPKSRTFSMGSKKSESLDNADGVVTVLVIENISGTEFDLLSSTDNHGILLHFLANTTEPISYTKFSRNGTLLLTAGPSGRTFDVFLLLPHPSSPCLGAVQHLYVLHRGATIAKILDLSFASDSRWVAISTANGTTHVFPITPYGGAINFRTHAGPKVVNRESRFHRSAGLDTLDNSVTSGIYHSSSTTKDQYPSVANPHGSLYRAASNPRLPPYASPQILFAASKIKQSSAHFVAAALPLVDYGTTVVSAVPAALTSAAGGALDSACNLKQRPSLNSASYRQMAANFAPARGLKAMGSPSLRNGNENCTDSLFIMRSNGQLSEYQLTVKAFTIGQRITDENPVELHVVPTVEWPLTQSKSEQETGFPLDPNNVLLQASAIKQRLSKFCN